MAQPTPPSAGRGVRRTQAPNRLTYEAFGNPTDYQGQTFGNNGRGHRENLNGGADGFQGGGHQASQVGGHQASQGGGHQKSQDGGPQGSQGGIPQEIDEGGPQGYQAGARRGSHVGAPHGSAKSVKSTTSSAAVRLRQVNLDAQKKMDALDDKLAAKQNELRKAQSKLQRAVAKLQILNTEDGEAIGTPERRALEFEVVDLEADIELFDEEIVQMKADLSRKKAIILEEKAVSVDVIVEEENSENSSLPKDKKFDVEDWVDDQQEVLKTGGYFYQHNVNPPPAAVSHDDNVVTKLVSALGQAFGGSHQSSNSIITKQVDKDLPIFSGKPEDWLTFKCEYDRTSWKYRYDDSENIVRLRKFVKGPAKDSINHLLANPANATKVMETLERRFGNPQFVLSSLIDKAKGVKSPDVNRPETIVDFGTAVDVLVTNIIAFKMHDYLNNIQLLTELVEKLPAVLRRDWYRWMKTQGGKENLEAFQNWLSSEVDTAIRSIKPQVEEEKKFEKGRRQHGFNAASEKTDNCACCDKPRHTITSCYSFKRMKTEDRWKVVRDAKLCFQCLEKGHLSSSCPSSRICGLEECDKSHHRMLHRRKGDPAFLKGERKEKPAAADGVSQHTANMAGNVARPLINVKLTGPLGTRKVLALLDMGCSFTAVEEDVARQLGMQIRRSKFTFEVFKGRKETEEECGETTCEIAGLSRNAQRYKLKEVKTMKKLGISGNPLDFEDLVRKHPHLRCSRASSIQDRAPQMVIGYDNYRLYHSRRAIEGSNLDDPSAHQCRLGWYICTGGSSAECFYACEKCQDENDKELHQQMKDFFSTETAGVKNVIPSRSKEDKRALELLEDNTKQKDGRWETCLLWKEDEAILPDSKGMAIRRLHMMERKMERDAEFSELVKKKFDDYLEKGYLIPAKPHQSELEPSPRKWYLPWFFAYHPTKKPRLVYDAAAKVNGKSLNDFLLKGPDLLNPLPSVLMKFRLNKIAITGDIKEMFHQVKLRKEDWPSQTILYRKDRTSEPQEFYMTVLFFGAASSPCSAIFAKNKNAELFKNEYPAAVEAIHNNFYMDDYLGSTATEEEAIVLRKQITTIHEAGGFQIVKWNSNSQRVLHSIPEALRAERDVQMHSKSDVCLDKTLGMWWCPSTDNFQYKINLEKIPTAVINQERRMTKREVTSVVMSLFDPLGFLAPVKVKALIIIQNIWKSGISWDDELTPLLESQWNSWLIELENVRTVKIPRQMTSLDYQSVEMHIFVDASEEAYTSSCYLRFTSGKNVEQCFVSGKARVAPIKGLTIPRMELEAALMGSRLSSTVKSTFGESIRICKTTFWSDSKTVLCWLRSQSGRFKVYVQTRVGEILENSEVGDWRWIPTKQNVADDATRSRSNLEFTSTCRWLIGVELLLKNEDFWPKEEKGISNSGNPDDLEIRHVAFSANPVSTFCLPEVSKFSSWMRLIRSTAAVLLAIPKFKKIGPGYITVTDMKRAEVMCMRWAQSESFFEEVEAAKLGEVFKNSSRLRMLSVGINEEGLLVLRGRLDAADIGKEAKRPVLLDPKHPYTKLWIQWIHEISGHHGQERVISEIRKTAWILDCRNAVRRCWATCSICKLRKLQPNNPEMGQLPVCRLGEEKQLFFHTGVDLFGPLSVRVNRSIQKRWGIIFTCMSTRAVFLDLVESLEAAEVLHAIARFSSLRGPPCHIWSDNGSNFVAANKEMAKAMREWDQQYLQRSLSVRGVQWHFNPPAAPHMGGSWERLIGCAKKILQSLLKCQAPRESVLRTVLYQAADILNSRPLTYASTDPDDPEVITPNHLLKMTIMDGPDIPGQFEEKDRLRRSWKYAQYLADEFWRRWTAEYLPTLLKREKWIQSSEPLKEGDIVYLVDDLIPRSAWKKGIVVATYPGKDGVVRVLDLRVALGKVSKKEKITCTVLRRPVRKVIPLGLNCLVTGSHWEGENVPASLEQQRDCREIGEEEEKTGGAEKEREK